MNPPPEPPAPILRVVIGEDDVLLREGIARILTGLRHEVVGQAGDADELVGESLAHRPDVIISDVEMPPRHKDDGLRAAIEIPRRLHDVGLLILSQYCEPDAARELIGQHPAGVGYLLKGSVGDVDTFADALTRVARGASALDAEGVGGLVGRRTVDSGVGVLTPVSLPFSPRWLEAAPTSGLNASFTSARHRSKRT